MLAKPGNLYNESYTRHAHLTTSMYSRNRSRTTLHTLNALAPNLYTHTYQSPDASAPGDGDGEADGSSNCTSAE